LSVDNKHNYPVCLQCFTAVI